MRTNGFSLVEVLVALVVVSVGMLGIAGLYVNGLKAGRTAMFSHQAVTLAGDVADRIRANPRAGAAYQGNGVNHNCTAGGTDCDAVQMAATDIFFWQQQADAALPEGQVRVKVQFNPPKHTIICSRQFTRESSGGANPPEYTIEVIWNEPGVIRNEPRNCFGIMIPVLGI